MQSRLDDSSSAEFCKLPRRIGKTVPVETGAVLLVTTLSLPPFLECISAGCYSSAFVFPMFCDKLEYNSAGKFRPFKCTTDRTVAATKGAFVLKEVWTADPIKSYQSMIH